MKVPALNARTVSSILWRGGALAATLLAALILPAQEFGRLATSLAVSAIVSQFAAFGLLQIVVRNISLRRQDNRLTSSQWKVFAVQSVTVMLAFAAASNHFLLHPALLIHGLAVALANLRFGILLFEPARRRALVFASLMGGTFILLIWLVHTFGGDAPLAFQGVAILGVVGLFPFGKRDGRDGSEPARHFELQPIRSTAMESVHFGLANVLTLPLIMIVIIATSIVEGEVRGGEFSLANTTRNVACFYALQIAATLPAMIADRPMDQQRIIQNQRYVSVLSAIGVSVALGGFYALNQKLTLLNAGWVVVASGMQALCVIDGVSLMLRMSAKHAFLANLSWALVLVGIASLFFARTQSLHAELSIVLGYAALYVTQRSLLLRRT